MVPRLERVCHRLVASVQRHTEFCPKHRFAQTAGKAIGLTVLSKVGSLPDIDMIHNPALTDDGITLMAVTRSDTTEQSCHHISIA